MKIDLPTLSAIERVFHAREQLPDGDLSSLEDIC